MLLCACSGGSTFSPKGAATPTPSPVPTGSATAYVCPTSDSASSSIASADEARRIAPLRHQAATATPGLIAVSYARTTALNSHAALVAREVSLGANLVREYDFPHARLLTRVLSVAPARTASVEAALRALPGVRAVGATGARLHPSSVTGPYFPNDPYFTGFSTTIAPSSGGTPPPPTYEVGPLEGGTSLPSQWDMHAVQLEHAFAYSQPGNGSGVTNAKALGSSGVKLAIIDTGEDSTHPELSSKIAYQRCFITNPSGNQSRSNFSTDMLGHGTDVSGIAAADLGNGLGFTGAGGNATIYAYRVFPTPDDSCASDKTADAQCDADLGDIVSAIEDALAQHVNVINLSLGGGTCSSGGVDPDPLQGAAIADAIADNVIVVAAAGNNSSGGSIAPLEAPACDDGVIAAGATSLADGFPNGAGNSDGTAANPFEYVASYSNAGSPGAAFGSASAWGIVAPGGDPSAAEESGASAIDYFHWITNIWTSTPYQASAGDETFVGNCHDDYPNGDLATPPVDCRVVIAGTSMASPHIAGAAALILAVNSAYQSPAAMKQLLCSTADDIGDPNEGCGRLNIYRAMAAALKDPNPPPTSPVP
jgi:hypothetical protein